MVDKIPEYEDYCNECESKTRMKFVKREDEYLIYECSLCSHKEELSEAEMEEKLSEEDWEEWKDEWEE